MKTREQLDFLGKEREPDEAPEIPNTVSCVVEEEHEFPYRKIAIQSSVVWYWAIRRFLVHGLDFRFTKSGFGKMAVKYARWIKAEIGDDWEDNTEYVEWYLARYDDFTKYRAKYNFDFLSSTAALNQFKARKMEPSQVIVETDEDRRTHEGTVITELDGPVRHDGEWIRDLT